MAKNQPRSCGFLIVSGTPAHSFLLMKHPDRWDLPKGHVDPGETDLECALRELEEETGFARGDLSIDTEFCFEHHYPVSVRRYGTQQDDVVEKKLRIFLAAIAQPREPVLTEHIGYSWFPWQPPHRIQEQTIDPLLAHVASHLESQRDGPDE